jgi:hypothetical protein
MGIIRQHAAHDSARCVRISGAADYAFGSNPPYEFSFATITSRINSAKLDASIGRQNHTTSPSAKTTFVFVTSASTASHRNVRDDRDPPLSWVRRAELSP